MRLNILSVLKLLPQLVVVDRYGVFAVESLVLDGLLRSYCSIQRAHDTDGFSDHFIDAHHEVYLFCALFVYLLLDTCKKLIKSGLHFR